MEIHILVQDANESANDFAIRITAFCKTISTERLDVQFTTASNGRQTCNLIWNPYKITKVITEGI
jgi:hypothetical protein